MANIAYLEILIVVPSPTTPIYLIHARSLRWIYFVRKVLKHLTLCVSWCSGLQFVWSSVLYDLLYVF